MPNLCVVGAGEPDNRPRKAVTALAALVLCLLGGVGLRGQAARGAPPRAQFSITATSQGSTSIVVVPGREPVTEHFRLTDLSGRSISLALGLQTAIRRSDTQTYGFSDPTGFAADLQLPAQVTTLAPHRSKVLPVLIRRPAHSRSEQYAVITAQEAGQPTSPLTLGRLFVVLRASDQLAPAPSTSDDHNAGVWVAAALAALQLLLLLLTVGRRRRRRA